MSSRVLESLGRLSSVVVLGWGRGVGGLKAELMSYRYVYLVLYSSGSHISIATELTSTL